MSASTIPAAAAGSGFPAPQLLLDTVDIAPVTLDGVTVNVRNPVNVLLAGVPDALFSPELDAEVRLFRWRSSHPQGLNRPTRSGRYAPCPHIVGGVNPYNASGWLGGNDDQTSPLRIGAFKLSGFGHGDRIEITSGALTHCVYKQADALIAFNTTISASVLVPSWEKWSARRPSPSWGIPRNVQPCRFGAAFVGRNSENPQHWDLLSPLSWFMIATEHNPFWFDQSAAGNVPPTSNSAGERYWLADGRYDRTRLACRVSNSEWVAGAR